MSATNANGRATEVDTPDAITAKGAILGATLKNIPSVAARQVAGFRRLVAELFPTEETVARYRTAHAEIGDEFEEADLCRRGCGRLALYNGECFSCGSERRIRA